MFRHFLLLISLNLLAASVWCDNQAPIPDDGPPASTGGPDQADTESPLSQSDQDIINMSETDQERHLDLSADDGDDDDDFANDEDDAAAASAALAELPPATVEPIDGDLLEALKKIKVNEDGQPKTNAEPWREPNNRMDFLRLLESRFNWHYEKQYDYINNLLVDELPTIPFVTENMIKARELLERERQRSIWMFRNRALVEALDQFVSLTKLADKDFQCSREAYAILWKNDRATRGQAHRPPSRLGKQKDPELPRRGLRRIELMVHHFSVQHSINCFLVYPLRLIYLRSRMDKRTVWRVESFMDNLLGSRDCIRTKWRSIEGPQAVREAYKSIKMNARDDPDIRYLGLTVDERTGQLVVKRQGIRMLAERYIVEPCRRYVMHLGPDVFVPARFGVRVLEKEDRYTEAQSEFLHSWLHYRLCESLVRHDKEALMEGLADYIEYKFS